VSKWGLSRFMALYVLISWIVWSL